MPVASNTHLKNTSCPNFTKFSVHVTCGLHSLLKRSGVCTSGFKDDVMFAHNRRGRAYTPSDSPVAAPGTKSDVDDCLVISCRVFPFRQIVAILHAWSINTTAIYNVVQKTPPYYFLNKLSQKGTDFNIFAHGILKKLTHTRLCICPSHLINVTALPCEIHNSFIWSKFSCFSRKNGRLWKQPVIMLQCIATWIWEKQHHKVW